MTTATQSSSQAASFAKRPRLKAGGQKKPALLPSILCGLGLLATTTSAQANPLDAFGLGARAPALGSAYAAVADDSAAGYYNPAGLARSGELHIDLGYQAARPALSVSGQRQQLLDTRGLTAGIVLPGRVLGVQMAFGLSLFLPDQHITRIHVLSHDLPRLHMYDNRTQRFFLAANLAVRLWRGLYVGGGLSFLSRSSGSVQLKGQIGLTDPAGSTLTSAVAVDLLAVRYPQVGLLWEVTRQLSLALVYRHRFLLQLEQGFNIDADVADPGREPVVTGGKLRELARSVDLFQPWQLVLGTALRLPSVQLSFDLTYSRFSEQPAPAATFTLDLDIGQLGDLVKLPKSVPYPDPGFHDLLIPAVGVEWRAIDGAAGDRLALDLRAGYRYEASPVPEQLGESSFGDADKHIVSCGFGLQLSRLSKSFAKPLSLDGFAAVTMLPLRRFDKSDPRSPVGDFTVSGTVWQAGGQLRWRL